MRYKWICPECGMGKLLGARPRKNATARFCLPCSKRAGVLVERTSPRLEARRVLSRERRMAAQRLKVDRQRARWTVEGTDMRRLLAHVWKVARTVCRLLPKEPPVLTMRKNSWASGRAYYHQHRIHLGNNGDLSEMTNTLLHEVAHFMAWKRDYMETGHGAGFNGALIDIETAWAERG